MASDGLSRRATWPDRAVLGFVAVLLLVGAGWVGATWVDPSGTDLTCGGLYRTDLWVHGPDICTRIMLRRLGVVVVLLMFAGGLIFLAVRRPRTPMP